MTLADGQKSVKPSYLAIMHILKGELFRVFCFYRKTVRPTDDPITTQWPEQVKQ